MAGWFVLLLKVGQIHILLPVLPLVKTSVLAKIWQQQEAGPALSPATAPANNEKGQHK
jgi:hypothetical protein